MPEGGKRTTCTFGLFGTNFEKIMAAEPGLDYEAVGKQFVTAFYTMFDADRSQIVSVYHVRIMIKKI